MPTLSPVLVFNKEALQLRVREARWRFAGKQWGHRLTALPTDRAVPQFSRKMLASTCSLSNAIVSTLYDCVDTELR